MKKHIENYLDYCLSQKRLDAKTIKAYQIDLTQFSNYIKDIEPGVITPDTLEIYIRYLHKNYQPKTVKRKIASLKALFRYFEYKEMITLNPFNKIQIKFREHITLPKTIPIYTVEQLLRTIYLRKNSAKTIYQKREAIKDSAICEMLFATGMRISELCSLNVYDVNLVDGTILIHGKGSKERRIQLANTDVVEILKNYRNTYSAYAKNCSSFFVNQSGRQLSEQSVRRMINKYTRIAGIEQHITPHMFRHTFATSLLEADVDIRYIQEMLGHSSINITEIYTHVAVAKQRDILMTKHPRKDFNIY